MTNIEFWKERENRTVDPTLYSSQAESLAKTLAQECEDSRKRKNKRTQIRKFYDEIVRLDTAARALKLALERFDVNEEFRRRAADELKDWLDQHVPPTS